MNIGVAKEIGPNERRVAATPDSVRQIKAAGYDVLVEAGAGSGAYLEDRAYQEAGGTIVAEPADLWSQSQAILKIQPPLPNPSLGKLISDGQDVSSSMWWLVTFPGLTIVLIVLCINFIGDGLRDALDPTQRRTRA